jgi:hypothetical protein
MRPQIKPGLRRVWRDDSTLQIGLTPDHGVVVAGLGPDEARLIDRLDGTSLVGDLTAWAGARGLPPARVQSLLHLLGDAGVLTGRPTNRAHLHQLSDLQRQQLQPDAVAWSVAYPDAGDGYELLARRARHRVVIIGRGRLAAATQSAVRRTGVAVRTSEHPAALAELAELAEPAEPADQGEPSAAYGVVVLVGEDAVSTRSGAALVAEHRPHLAVVAGADRATVGPLVLPGRSACLRCLELYRTDRDPGWPAIAAQLDEPPAATRGESTLTELAAALVALQVICWADEHRTPASLGATLTVTLPDGLIERRPWAMHPRCGCGWLAASLPADRTATAELRIPPDR